MPVVRRYLIFIALSFLAHLLIFQLKLEQPAAVHEPSAIGVSMLVRSFTAAPWRQPADPPPAPAAPSRPQATEPQPVVTRPAAAEPTKLKSQVEPAPVAPDPIERQAAVMESRAPESSLTAAQQPPNLSASGPVDAAGTAVAQIPSSSPSMPSPAAPPSVTVVEGVTLAQPRYAVNPPPEYPETALRKGWQGAVQLAVLVQADGRVADVVVEQTSGHRVLDRAALRAVKRWQFEPARSLGRPVESRVMVPVVFELRQD